MRAIANFKNKFKCTCTKEIKCTKHYIYDLMKFTLLNGSLVNFIFSSLFHFPYGFFITPFTIIGFGLVYYFIVIEFPNWIRELRRAIR